MPLVKTQQSSHWYDAQGNPCYEVPYADPSKGMRKTTLGDARKLNLYPSVTSILSVIHKPALDAWKTEQGILAALTDEQGKDESLDDFAKRVAQEASEVASKAADFGTAVHYGIIDNWLAQGVIEDIVQDCDTSAQRNAYIDWHNKNVTDVIQLEECFTNTEHGYGGKRDIFGIGKDLRPVLIDIKTTKSQPKKKITGWVEQGMQLAAYATVLPDNTQLLNVYLSSTEPGRLEVKDWTEDRDFLFDGFLKAAELWRWLNKYDPRKGDL